MCPVRTFVLLVGRARFELATNGLKGLRIVSNSNQTIGLNLERKWCGVGGWSLGAGCELSEFLCCRQRCIGVSG